MVAPSNQVFTQGSNTPVSADQLNTFVQTVASVASLRTFTGTVGMEIELQGTTGPGTGNAGPFYWNATSTAADDGANVIAPTGSTIGRWLRNLETPLFSAFTVSSADTQNFVTVAPGNINRAFASSVPQVNSQYNSNASGGTNGTVSFNGKFYSSIFGAPNQFIWSLIGVLDYDGTGGTGQHVAVYAQALRRTFAAGGAANNPEIWAGTFESRDLSNQPSSATNVQLGIEIDVLANGLDDANKRQGISLVVGKAQTGTAPEISTGIGLYSADGVSSMKTGIFVGTPYSIAGIDFRTATQTSGNAVWLGDNKTIAWDTGGTAKTRWDPTINSAAGGVRFNTFVQFDGVLFAPNSSTFGGLITAAAGASFSGAPVTIDGNTNFRLTAQVNGAAAQTATMTNAPLAGNPNFWIPILVNGVTRFIAAW